jgi:hypothetical protein
LGPRLKSRRISLNNKNLSRVRKIFTKIFLNARPVGLASPSKGFYYLYLFFVFYIANHYMTFGADSFGFRLDVIVFGKI